MTLTTTHNPELTTLAIEPLPDRWTSLPWCLIWSIWSIGTRASTAERITTRVAAHCGVAEPTAPAPTLLAVDDLDLREFLTGFDAAELARVANRQRMWTRPDAPTKAATVVAWAQVLVDRDVVDLYRATAALDDPDAYTEITHALGQVPGDRSGLRRCALWTAIAADHQVRPDAHNAQWLQERLMAHDAAPGYAADQAAGRATGQTRNPAGLATGDPRGMPEDRFSVLDLRPMLTRVAAERSTSIAHVTPRELDHALTRHRLLQ